MIVDCLGMIEDIDGTVQEATDNGQVDEALDSMVPIYTHDLTGWLHSHNGRMFYVEQATEEMGTPENLIIGLQMGYKQELMEVFYSVLASLTETIEAEEDAA